MIPRRHKPGARRFQTIWGELEYLCEKVHRGLYEKRDASTARRMQGRLSRVLNLLPENGIAILREEGWALFHELQEDFAVAIQHRKREIRLIERLHESVKHSIESGEYDAKMGDSILEKWDVAALQKRREILDFLSDVRRRPAGTSKPRVRRTGMTDSGQSGLHSSKDRTMGRKRPA
jgi:hypothetical protein